MYIVYARVLTYQQFAFNSITPTKLRRYFFYNSTTGRIQVGSSYSRVTRRSDLSSFWDLKMCPGGISKLSGILLKPETCSHRICVAFLWVVHKLVRLRPRSPTHFYSLCICGSEKGEWWRRAFALHGLIVELSCFVFIYLLLLFYRDKQHCTECHINI